MPWHLHEQYVDVASGFHVIELRDARGNQNFRQIMLRGLGCPACGAAHVKTNIEELDVQGTIAQAIAEQNFMEEQMLEHAKKNGLVVR